MIKTKEFEIDQFTYTVANEALKDILFMYYRMDDYNGFGGAETGQFNPYWFLKVKVSEPGYLSDKDIRLLEQGAAVKVLNWVYDEVLDCEKNVLPPDHWSKTLIESGAMKRTLIAEKALISAFQDFSRFEAYLSQVYHELIVGFFKNYANG